jgi:hypothetical protein
MGLNAKKTTVFSQVARADGAGHSFFRRERPHLVRERSFPTFVRQNDRLATTGLGQKNLQKNPSVFSQLFDKSGTAPMMLFTSLTQWGNPSAFGNGSLHHPWDAAFTFGQPIKTAAAAECLIE